MIITINPDYQEAQETAWRVLKTFSDYELPIKLSTIVDQLPNLQVMTYSDLAKLYGCHAWEVPEIVDSEDGTIWQSVESGSYIIVYNNLINNHGRIRFTIAHELGHYFLGHSNIDNPSLITSTNGYLEFVADDEYKQDEKEANYFAKRLLAPVPIVVDIANATGGGISVRDVASIFDMSFTAAQYVVSNINGISERGMCPVDSELSLLFSNSVNKIAPYYTPEAVM